jgi:hypothetical protein
MDTAPTTPLATDTEVIPAADGTGTMATNEETDAAATTDASCTLCAADGTLVPLPRAALGLNTTLHNMLGDCTGTVTTVVPVPLSSGVLATVVEFCTDVTRDLEAAKLAWHDRVKAMDGGPVGDLFRAADFLNNAPLLDVCARAVAARIEATPVEELAAYIGVDPQAEDSEGQ